MSASAPTHAPARAPAMRAALRRHAPALFLGALFMFATSVYWTGIGPHDAEEYVVAALAWRDGPFLGETHWALRHLFVLPMAGALALFGGGEFAATLPNILYAGGLVAITFVYGRKYLGRAAGLAAAALIAVSAFFAGMQTEIRIFGPETFFLALASWIFIGALARPRPVRAFALAGLVAGGAWLCREVAIFLPAAFGLVLLLRRPIDIPAGMAVATGFLAVIAAELLLYGAVADDPLYRYRISLGHDGAENAAEIAGLDVGLVGWLMRPVEQLLTYPPITPFVLAAGAVFLIPGFRRSLSSPERRAPLVLFAVASGLSMLVSGYALGVTEPHYYPILAYASLIALGVFGVWLYESGRKRLAAGFFAGLALLNFAAADFRSYEEYAEPRRLARFLLEGGESVATDHITARRARMYLTLAGVEAEAAARRAVSLAESPEARCGLVFAATPNGDRRAIEPDADWRPIWGEKVRRTRATHALLAALGADKAPGRLGEIARGAPPVVLYAAPPCPRV